MRPLRRLSMEYYKVIALTDDKAHFHSSMCQYLERVGVAISISDSDYILLDFNYNFTDGDQLLFFLKEEVIKVSKEEYDIDCLINQLET